MFVVAFDRYLFEFGLCFGLGPRQATLIGILNGGSFVAFARYLLILVVLWVVFVCFEHQSLGPRQAILVGILNRRHEKFSFIVEFGLNNV